MCLQKYIFTFVFQSDFFSTELYLPLSCWVKLKYTKIAMRKWIMMMVVLLQTMQGIAGTDGIAQNDGRPQNSGRLLNDSIVQTDSIAQTETVTAEAVRVERCPGDCRLHVLAGAAIAIGTSSVVYLTAGQVSVLAKAAAVIGTGVAAAAFFGAAKELYDAMRADKHNAEWRDFWNTVMGGSAGAAVTWAFYAALQSPVLAAIISTVGMLVTGYRPALQLLTGKDRLRKN